MIDDFTAHVTTTSTQIVLKLSGTIGEHAQFPALNPNLPLHIDFDEVTRINSRGLRLWCQWIEQFEWPTQIHFERCPSTIVKNFNLVKGCIPSGVHVDSIYVPLYSPQTGERREYLLSRGKEFQGTTVNVPEQKDSEGNLMEVDVHESYWSFLKL